MSPRAALRLEMLGVQRVFDYVAGKQEWLAALLPSQGNGQLPPRAGEVLTTDVPTCRADDVVANLPERSEYVVTTPGGVVLGTLTAEDGDAAAGQRAESRMRPGPTTIRPSEWLAPLVERMRDANVERVLVTNPEGVLLGKVLRDHAEALLRETQVHHEHAA